MLSESVVLLFGFRSNKNRQRKCQRQTMIHRVERLASQPLSCLLFTSFAKLLPGIPPRLRQSRVGRCIPSQRAGHPSSIQPEKLAEGRQLFAQCTRYEPADPQRSNELELLARQLEVKPSPADQYFTSDIVREWRAEEEHRARSVFRCAK